MVIVKKKFIDVGMVIIYITKSENRLLSIVGFEALYVYLAWCLLECKWQIIVIQNSRPNYSGVKPVDKREGGGAHNWGNHRDDIEWVWVWSICAPWLLFWQPHHGSVYIGNALHVCSYCLDYVLCQSCFFFLFQIYCLSLSFIPTFISFTFLLTCHVGSRRHKIIYK